MAEGAKKSFTAITLSLVIHCLLLVVIIIQVDSGAQRKRKLFDSELKKQPIIAAQLVVTPKIKPPVKKVKPQVVKSVENNRVSNSDKPAVKSNKIAKMVVTTEIKSESSRKKNAVVVTSITPALVSDKKKFVTRPIPIVSNRKNQALSTMALSRKFLRKSVVEAPNYNADTENSGMSVMNNNLAQHEYKLIEISVEEQRLVKVTCDNTAKKVLAGIAAGLLGGTLRCESGPDLSSFIKKKPKPKFKYKLNQ